MSNDDKRKLSEWTEGERSGLRVFILVIGMLLYSLFGLAGLIFLIMKG